LVPVLRRDGQQLQKLDWLAGRPLIISYWQGYFYHPGMVPSEIPAGPLDRPLDLWVNNSFGSDAHDGLSNDAAHALLTVQVAVNKAFNYQPGPYPVNIHVMNGSGPYGGAVTPIYAGAAVNLIGESPNTMLDGNLAAGDKRYGFLVQGPNSVTVNNMAFRDSSMTYGGAMLCAGSGASMSATNVYMHNTGSFMFLSSQNGIMVVGNVVLYGNSYCVFNATGGGFLSYHTGTSFSIANPISVSYATLACGGNGVSGVPSTMSGWSGYNLMTGSKYSMGLNGVCNDQFGGAANPWFPGSLPGGVSTGGQYV
jgi:hypothetical protein